MNNSQKKIVELKDQLRAIEAAAIRHSEMPEVAQAERTIVVDVTGFHIRTVTMLPEYWEAIKPTVEYLREDLCDAQRSSDSKI